MICEVGLADMENSELPPPLLPVDPTVRRGEITQPFATINKFASNNANLRMGVSFLGRIPIKNESNTFGLFLVVQMFAGAA
jgi:hypothetical protein